MDSAEFRYMVNEVSVQVWSTVGIHTEPIKGLFLCLWLGLVILGWPMAMFINVLVIFH